MSTMQTDPAIARALALRPKAQGSAPSSTDPAIAAALAVRRRKFAPASPGFDFGDQHAQRFDGGGGMDVPALGPAPAPPRMVDLGGGQSVILDHAGNVMPSQGIRAVPDPTFTENVGRGFMHGAANALPAGLPGVQAWQDRERLRSGGEGVGGIVGGGIGSLAGVVNPVNAAETYLSAGVGRAIRLVPGFDRVMGYVGAKLGTRAAGVLSNAVEEGGEEAAFAAVQQSQADADLWATDPAQAFKRMAIAAASAGALGAGMGGAMGAGPIGAIGRAANMQTPPAAASPNELQAARDFAQSYAEPGGNRVTSDTSQGAPASPIDRATLPPGVLPPASTATPSGGAIPASSLAQVPNRRDRRSGEQGAAATATVQETAGSSAVVLSDRPSLEAEATRLGVPFTERTRTVDLARWVEAFRSEAPLATEQTTPPQTRSETTAEAPSPTPSPAEGGLILESAARTDRQGQASSLEAPENHASSPSSATRREFPPKDAPQESSLPARDSQQPVAVSQVESASEGSRVPSPNPTRSRQPWEMTREEWNHQVGASATEAADVSTAGSTSGVESPAFASRAEAEAWGDQHGFHPSRRHFKSYRESRESPTEWRLVSFDVPHMRAVRQALSENRPVPPEVLAEYPDLRPPESPSPPAKGADEAPRDSAPREPWEPVSVKMTSPEASTRFGVGGEREGFEVANKGGGKIIGRLRDADFPGQKSKESRGELFFAEVPSHLRRKGVASALIKDAMRLMAANGAETVKLTVPSKMGRPMIEALQKRGVLGETVQISEQSGTMEVRNPYFERTATPSRPPSPPPTADVPAGGGGARTPVARWDVYPVHVKGRGTRYAVRESSDARGFGDTIHETPEAAAKYANESKEREAKNADFRAAENEKASADAARKAAEADVDGFADDKPPMVKGRVVKSLQALARIDGEVKSIRDHVRAMVADGNVELSTREESKIQPMSRAAFNRADGRQQAAHEAKMKAAGSKTVYLVNGRDLGKTGYDYAAHLRDKPTTPALPPSPPPTADVPAGGGGAKRAINSGREDAHKPVPSSRPEETVRDRLAAGRSASVGRLIDTQNNSEMGLSLRPDSSEVGAFSVVAKGSGGSQSFRMKYRPFNNLADVMGHFENYLNMGDHGRFVVELADARSSVPKTAKPPRVLGTGSPEGDARLAELRKRSKSGGMTYLHERELEILEARAASDPSKWAAGDGVGYKVFSGGKSSQTNRGFRVKEIDADRKMALVEQVADTGLTSTGGNNDRIRDEWKPIAELVRDRKYDRPAPKPTPDTTTPTPEASPGGKPSLADRLEADARAKIKAIDADVAKRRKGAKKGERLGAAPIFDYLVPYAQIALAKSIRAVNTVGQKVKVLRKYVREALKEAGISDRKTENRVLKLARAMVADATEADGSFSQERLYEVMDDAQQAFTRPTKGAETKATIIDNTGQAKQDKTITERQALRARLRGQRDAAPGIFKAGEVSGADKGEVKTRSRTLRAMLKMRKLGKAEGIAEGKARLESALDNIRLKRGSVESLQKEAAAAVRRMILPSKRGEWFAQIKGVKTPEKLAGILNAVKVERARTEGTSAAKWIDANAKDSALIRLFGAGSEELQAVRAIRRDAEGYLRDLDSPDMDTALIAADNLATAKYEIQTAMHEAKAQHTMRLKGKRLSAAEARKDVGEAIATTGKPLPADAATGGLQKNPSVLRRWMRKMYTPDILARTLDGGWKQDGPVTRQMNNLVDGVNRKHELRRTFHEAMNTLAVKYGYRDMGDALAKISGTLGRQTQETIPVAVGGRRLTKGQALYLAIMDPKAKAHASNGGEFVWSQDKDAPKFKIDNDLRARVYDALDTKDLAMVGEMKKLYNETFFSEVDRVSVNLNGSHLVRQPDYMRISRYQPQSEGAGEPKSMRHISRRHLEDAGFLKPRTGGKAPIVLGDALLDLLSMGESAANVAGVAEPARFAEMVLLHGDTRTAVRNTAGVSGVKRLEQIVYGLAEQVQSMDTGQRVMREIVSNVAASKTQLNYKTWLRQIGGVFPLWTGMDSKTWASGLRGVADLGLERDLEARSGYFWNRWNGGPYSAYVGLQAIPDGQGIPGSAFKDAGRATLRQLRVAALQAGRLRLGEAGTEIGGAYRAFKQLRNTLTVGNWFDAIPARVAYAGFIAKAKTDHPGWSLDRQKNWAAKQAEAVFRKTQNTADWMNATGWQQDASTNAMLSPFLTFTSQPAKMTNLAVASFNQGGEATGKFVAALAMSAAWSAAVTGGAMAGRAALQRALHGEKLEDEDVEKAMSAAKWQFAAEMVGIIPGAGSGMELVKRGMTGTWGQSSMDTPAGDVFKQLEQGAQDIVQGFARLDEEIDPRTGRPKRNRRMLTAQEKFLRGLDAIQSSTRSAMGDPLVPVTNDITRIAQEPK